MGGDTMIRPVRETDMAAVVALQAAEDLAHRGRSDFTLEMLVDQVVADSGFDAERDWVIAERDGVPVGVAVLSRRIATVTLAPDEETPQLRGELLDWTEGRQRELGRRALRSTTFAGHAAAVAALSERGYELECVYSLMVRRFSDSGPPGTAELDPGYVMRPIDPVTDGVALHALNERAFAERAAHTPSTAPDYIRSQLSYSAFAPSWSLLVERDGVAGPVASLVGWCPEDHPLGYVALLAVDPDHRRHGLGRALLLRAFGAIHAAGLPTAELHVASDNPGALGLYTRVAMVPTERFNDYTRPA